MNQTIDHPGLGRLDALTGSWDVTASIHGEDMGTARTEFHWMTGEPFVIQKSGTESLSDDGATEWAENAPDAVTMIIGLDDTNDRYSILYADARDVYRVYQMTLKDDTWKLWREAPGFSQRFTGTFSEDGNTISGTWETSSDGSTWEYDFDLAYSRVK